MGFTLFFNFGSYGGFYIYNGENSLRVCLGWFAMTLVYFDIDPFLQKKLSEEPSQTSQRKSPYIFYLEPESDDSAIIYGKLNGRNKRDELGLDRIDKEPNSEVHFVIPRHVMSVNPSFYLGLLTDSLKTLGEEDFDKKYKFTVVSELRSDESSQNAAKKVRRNLKDGKRYAIMDVYGWQS